MYTYGRQMSRGSQRVGIIGDGWSARLAAIAVAAAGLQVRMLTPWLHPDVLPRPFPPPDLEPWASMWRTASFGLEPFSWQVYGGRVIDPMRRRVVVEADHCATVALSANGLKLEPSDASWAWAEPAAGWTALWQVLAKRMATLPIEIVPQRGPLQLRVGVWGNVHVTDAPQVRRWLYIQAPCRGTVGWRQRQAIHRVRYGADADSMWWSTLEGLVWRTGVAAPEEVPCAVLPLAPPWGICDSRRLRLLRLPHPAATPPSVWAQALAEATRWLGARDVQPVAHPRTVVYSDGLSWAGGGGVSLPPQA